MISKLQIDTATGAVHVEGEEEFIKYIFTELKNEIRLNFSSNKS